MKSTKKVGFISALIVSVLLMSFVCANVARAQFLYPLLYPASILGLPAPPVSPISRAANIPLIGGGAVTTPSILATSWSGSWNSFVITKTIAFGPMSLSMIEDLIAGTFTGTVLMNFNPLIPVAIPVSGAYTGVGQTIALNGVYSTTTPVTIGGGPFPAVILVPVDYFLRLEFDIIGGTLISGLYSITSSNLVDSDAGGINLNIL